jgi:rRNA processing protein Gar1
VTVLDAAAAERGKLRRVLGRLDTVFFLISTMVVVDTIGELGVGTRSAGSRATLNRARGS